MLKQLLSLASIFFVIVCIGAIFTQFVDVDFLWKYIEQFYHIFDNEGSLEVQSFPSGAAIYINNEFVGQAPLAKKLANGTYDIKVVAAGYQTYARRIAIEKHENALLEAKLAKEYGTLHIVSAPVNATVFIDGERQGQLTPIDFQLAQGKYRIKVVKEKFYSFEEEIVVEQGKTTNVEADLVRQIGRMVVESTPPAAKAYIGNDLIGTTPFTQDKPIGQYVITLKKLGFRDKILEVNIAPDETLYINVELAGQVGALKIMTTPPGAQVYIDDAYQGETPLTVEKKPGEHRVSIAKKQYRDISELIVIEDNITKNINRSLDPALGELRVDSNPPHARVWIDSEDMGFTPVRTQRLAGIYTIRITKPGYKNYVEEVHVKEDTFIQVQPALEKDPNSTDQ